ncbi:MAG: site-specific integrase [Reichenbachiella sp.]|uniref:site-specific integrase n=1 Tax=Reichenbachiella sp. TaxID=2184521 RepID=UPI0032631E51
MGIITYRLNKGRLIKDTSKPTPIYFRYKLGRLIDFNASLNIKILESDWDEKRQKVRDRVHIKNRQEINNLLSSLKDYFENAEIEAKRNNVSLTYEYIRELFKEFISPTPKQKPVSLFEFIGDYIEKCQSRPTRSTGNPIAPGTLKTYKTSERLLLRFHKEKHPIDFDDINLDFYYDFIEWCEGQNLSKNYIGKQIKVLKTFMNHAFEHRLTSNDAFQSKRFSVLQEEAEDIYLTQEELLKMWHLDLSSNARLEKARDIFLIGAFTGLRVSDYSSINKKSISKLGDIEMLRIKTIKTGRVVAIPLHPMVRSILTNYNNQPPSMIEQEINRSIKIIGELAGITSREHKAITRGGKQVTKRYARNELIKSHTARRSFCTNAYLGGMDSIDIMAISGHTTEKNFLKYIKVTPEERAVRLAQHPFFNISPSTEIIKAK